MTQYQTPSHVRRSQAPSKSVATGFWMYENPPPEGQFSSSTSYESQSQPAATGEVFQGANFLPIIQPEELFSLESAVHFQSHSGAVEYSQPQAGPSTSYAVGTSSPSMLPSMLPPITIYEDAPPLQPPVMPTTHLPPNPYDQPPF